ncbi:MAG: hypothetical protein LBT13_09120 [Treponema sp.]|jgi:hypothetical protein|nr:hypothetical protein [Treponema sp.]
MKTDIPTIAGETFPRNRAGKLRIFLSTGEKDIIRYTLPGEWETPTEPAVEQVQPSGEAPQKS